MNNEDAIRQLDIYAIVDWGETKSERDRHLRFLLERFQQENVNFQWLVMN